MTLSQAPSPRLAGVYAEDLTSCSEDIFCEGRPLSVRCVLHKPEPLIYRG